MIALKWSFVVSLNEMKGSLWCGAGTYVLHLSIDEEKGTEKEKKISKNLFHFEENEYKIFPWFSNAMEVFHRRKLIKFKIIESKDVCGFSSLKHLCGSEKM